MSHGADDFLVEIAARPDDLELRSVFADWLLERGEPLGEFIALQLKPHPTPQERERERQLFSLHANAWLPPALREVIVSWSQQYEKGVLTRCRIKAAPPAKIAAARLDPRWATVRALAAAPLELIDECPLLESLTDLEPAVLDALVLARAPLPKLRELSGRFTRKTLGALAAAAGWNELGLLGAWGLGGGQSTRQRARWREEAEQEGLALAPPPREDPQLRPSRLQWLLASPLARQLARLELGVGHVDLAAFLDELEAVDTPLRELVLRDSEPDFGAREGPGRWGLSLRRGPRGWRSLAILPGDPKHARDDDAMLHAILLTARPGTFHEATLPRHSRLRPGSLPCLRKASRRFVD